MKKINICLILLFTLLLTSRVSYSQDSTATEPTFTLSGSVDTYFHSSFGVENGGGNAPSTSFANLKGFGLGMVNFIASYSGEKAGFTADVVFGPRGYDAVFANLYTGQSDEVGQRIINQAFAFYKLSDAVTLNMGQFNTFLGYEVISPAVNFHYSTSYMFSYGPFSHTGLRADFDFGGGLVGKLAVMNPTDLVEFNPVNTYTYGLQIGKTSDAGGVWLNFLYGDQDGTLDEDDFSGNVGETSAGNLFQGDLTLGYNLSETFYLGVNTSYQTVAAGETFTGAGDIEDIDADATSFFGVALYPKLTLSESFALGLRAEYFQLAKGHLSDGDGNPFVFARDEEGTGSVTAFTLSGNYKTGGLTIIPEFRIDMTSEDSFTDKDGEATDMMPTFNLAAVYKF